MKEYKLDKIDKFTELQYKQYFNQLHDIDRMIAYLENGCSNYRPDTNDDYIIG